MARRREGRKYSSIDLPVSVFEQLRELCEQSGLSQNRVIALLIRGAALSDLLPDRVVQKESDNAVQ